MQHHRLRGVAGLCVERRLRHRHIERAADLERQRALQRRGEGGRGLADQIGLADARKMRRRLSMPPSFALPPAIQKMSVKLVSAFPRRRRWWLSNR